MNDYATYSPEAKQPAIPSNFREVTAAHFHSTVGKLDVHPRPEKEASYWETPQRTLMGVSTPGYMCERDGKYTTDRQYFTAL